MLSKILGLGEGIKGEYVDREKGGFRYSFV